MLHAAAPLAPMLRKAAEKGGDPIAGSDAIADEAAAANSIPEAARQHFYAAQSAPADPDWPTHDTVLSGDKLESDMQFVINLLYELDSPPVARQRLAELVLERRPMPHTRSKYLAALRRVLQVGVARDVATFPGPGPQPTPSWPAEPRSSSMVPPLSPIPFLQHEEGALGLPPGPVDEVDTASDGGEHGGVSNTVTPLSATTDSSEEDVSKRARGSD